MLAHRSGEHDRRTDLDRITMLDWLREKRQPPRAIERFWRQVLVSAINEELDRMAAAHGFQVFRLGFLARAGRLRDGRAGGAAGRASTRAAWQTVGNVEFHLRSPVERIAIEDGRVAGVIAGGEQLHGRLLHLRAAVRARGRQSRRSWRSICAAFEHSPITGIHLWFDRPVTDLPHATLLDRTIQWMFNKHEARYVQLVVSASRSLMEMAART